MTTFKNIHVDGRHRRRRRFPRLRTESRALTDPVYLVTGLQVISFRVLTDDVDGLPKLQQKLGLFDPTTDNPGTAFTNVMENVEDLQVAYMYAQDAAARDANRTGLEHGDPDDRFGCGACPGCSTHVPSQAGPSGARSASRHHQRDRGAGLRHGAVPASSARGPEADERRRTEARLDDEPAFPPGLRGSRRDDGAPHAAYDLFDHYRATATLMLRNRIPRG